MKIDGARIFSLPGFSSFRMIEVRRDLISALSLFTSPLSAGRQTSCVVSNFWPASGKETFSFRHPFKSSPHSPAAVGALMKVRLLKLKGRELSELLRWPLVKYSPWDVENWRERREKDWTSKKKGRASKQASARTRAHEHGAERKGTVFTREHGNEMGSSEDRYSWIVSRGVDADERIHRFLKRNWLFSSTGIPRTFDRLT